MRAYGKRLLTKISVNGDRIAYLLKILYRRHYRMNIRYTFDLLLWKKKLRKNILSLVWLIKSVKNKNRDEIFWWGWLQLINNTKKPIVPIVKPPMLALKIAKAKPKYPIFFERPAALTRNPTPLTRDSSPIDVPNGLDLDFYPVRSRRPPSLSNKKPISPPIFPFEKPKAMTYLKIKSKEPIEKKFLFTKVTSTPETTTHIPIAVRRIPSKVVNRHSD